MTTSLQPPPDDLSGGQGAVKAADEVDALLKDAQARRAYRTGAVLATLVVLAALLYMLALIVQALTDNIKDASTPAVSLTGVLVVAIAVIAISLVRSTFAPREQSEKEKNHLVLPGVEALKELRDTFKSIADVFK